MATPTIVACPVGQWTKVLDAVSSGAVHKLKNGPTYLQTYRDAGAGPPPPNTSEAVLLFNGNIHVPVSASAPIDVYIWCRGDFGQGEVRVDS
jgi:hypothetical protein